MASLAPPRPAPAAGWSVDRLWLPAAACALALQALLVLAHEPWMDEWQALQVALAPPDLSALFAGLHYEGHPPLWYLMLRAIGALIPGRHVLPVILLPIALTTQIVVLRLKALPRWERLAIALNYTLLIEAGSISRSLSLGVLLSILAFTAERRALRWGAIALLPMADFLFGLLSMVAIAAAWRERKLWTPGLLLWAAMSVVAALSVIPAPDMAPAMPPDDSATQMVRGLAALSPQLVPIHMMDLRPTWGGLWYPASLAFAGGPMFLIFAAYLLRDAPFERTLLTLFAGTCLAINLALYWLSVRHFALVGLLLILLRIHAGPPEGGQRIAWRIWLALGAAGGLAGAVLSTIQPFDPGRGLATEILRRNLAHEDIVAWQEGTVQGIGVLAGREFTNLSKGCTEGYHLWDRRRPIDGRAGLYRELADYAGRHGRFYLVSEWGIPAGSLAVPFRQAAFAPRGYDGYDYHLYEIAWDRPHRGPLPRPCGPARRPLAQWF